MVAGGVRDLNVYSFTRGTNIIWNIVQVCGNFKVPPLEVLLALPKARSDARRPAILDLIPSQI